MRKAIAHKAVELCSRRPASISGSDARTAVFTFAEPINKPIRPTGSHGNSLLSELSRSKALDHVRVDYVLDSFEFPTEHE